MPSTISRAKENIAFLFPVNYPVSIYSDPAEMGGKQKDRIKL